MREGWRTAKLADLCEFRNGLWKGKKPPYVHVGVIRNTNFRADGSLDDSDIAYLDVEQKQFEKRSLQYGDLILEKSGGGPKQPVGRVVLFDKEDALYSFSNFTSVIRVLDSSHLDFNYLHRVLYWYYLSGATEMMQRRSTGIRNLDFGAYKALDIPLPPLPEQKRIVAILDEAFAGIATAVANTEKNLANARELFESYLSTTLSRQGEGCATRTLDELCSIARGGSPRPIRAFLTNDPGGINWIKISDATASSKYIYETKKKINPEGVKRSRMVNEGDLLLSNSMSFGRPYIMKTSGCIHDGWLVLSDKSGLYEKEYLYHYLGSSDAYRQFDSRASGSTVRNLNIDLVRTVSVPLPSLDTQREIVEALEDFAAECDRLESIYQQKLGAFGELKQSLLQKAFCGELTAGKVGASQPHEETSVA